MINVVAAIITNEEGKILITQKNLKKAQGGLWEFPGGKIEPNETKENAIVREIKEELADIVEVIEHETKIPVKKITEAETQKLLNLERNLHKRIIGFVKK